ncbi:aldo/keto reductase [Actinocorallia sp. A-T 12471]|uniref:aldo/keto reductase n=1 Tax=Actinocorallia sp. A-T 12471 TaxID=3089813 RepID=UPI0029D1CC55|nr:aldo/keto reductase [Actinocorallia sp. A-T 12471]MDX6742704.1 aldo/keto reductase [Actinocorallia sp. A-T 12471]
MSFGLFFIGRDLPVHRLGFGTARFVGDGHWGPRGERADAVRLLQSAVEAGVDLIDTAGDFGPGLAEEIVAEALHPYPLGLIVATKGGVARTSATEWHIDGRPQALRADCEASLERLRLDTIDLFTLGRIDPQVPLTEQLGALVELREEGKIRHIGLDGVSAAQLRAALEITEIVSVRQRFHMFDRSATALLELCEERAIAFLPCAGDSPRKAASDERVAEVARACEATPAQVALAWLLHRSPVLLPTPGTADPEHLAANLAAAELELTPEQIAALNALA